MCNGATRKREQGLLETFKRFSIEVVGGLVEQQKVSPLLKRERKVQTVALAAGEYVCWLLLVRPLKAANDARYARLLI